MVKLLLGAVLSRTTRQNRTETGIFLRVLESKNDLEKKTRTLIKEFLGNGVLLVFCSFCACVLSNACMWGCISLVPRPFPPPVFDGLQYANTEGEGLGLEL